MIIYATFATPTYAPDEPELIHAWDEYARDNNPDGYETSLQEEVTRWGADILHRVTVQIRVDSEHIAAALTPKVVLEGTVEQ